jgi:hypothetical protein
MLPRIAMTSASPSSAVDSESPAAALERAGAATRIMPRIKVPTRLTSTAMTTEVVGMQTVASEVAPAHNRNDADGELGAQEPVGGTASTPVPTVVNREMIIDPRHPVPKVWARLVDGGKDLVGIGGAERAQHEPRRAQLVGERDQGEMAPRHRRLRPTGVSW